MTAARMGGGRELGLTGAMLQHYRRMGEVTFHLYPTKTRKAYINDPWLKNLKYKIRVVDTGAAPGKHRA